MAADHDTEMAGLVLPGSRASGYHASGFPMFSSMPSQRNDTSFNDLEMPTSMKYSQEGIYDNTPGQSLPMPNTMAYSSDGLYDNAQQAMQSLKVSETPNPKSKGTEGRLKEDDADEARGEFTEEGIVHRSEARIAFMEGSMLLDPDKGQPCLKCDTCPGWDMHYWRKICKWCRCPRSGHKSHEIEQRRYKKDPVQSDMHDMQAVISGDSKVAELLAKKYAWVPLGLSAEDIEDYFRCIPPENVPVIGSKGEIWRHQQLLEQLPDHDTNFKSCDQLTQKEIEWFDAFDEIRMKEAFDIGEVIHCPDFSQPTDCPECFLRDDGTHWPYCSKYVDPAAAEAAKSKGNRGGAAAAAASSANTMIEDDAVAAALGLAPMRSIKEMKRGKQKVQEIKLPEPEPEAPQAPKPAGGNCRACLMPLVVGELVVTFGRFKDGTQYFHPRCFACSQCFELLVDLRGFVDFGREERGMPSAEQRLFCGRHWADNIKPRCFACDESIHESTHVFEMDRPWHKRHFCCYICDANLTRHQKYVPRDSRPLCFACYAAHIADKCTSCGGTINPLPGHGGKISIKRKHWHAACFCCKRCGTRLEGKPAVPHGDVLYCKKCYKRMLRES